MSGQLPDRYLSADGRVTSSVPSEDDEEDDVEIEAVDEEDLSQGG